MDKKNIIKEYKKDELSIYWRPSMCIHAGECVKRLPAVYDPDRKPWIDTSKADINELMHQIDHCPSGALSYKITSKELDASENTSPTPCTIDLAPNGPLLVEGDFTITFQDGKIETFSGKKALCRCGASQNKPFCDGAHSKVNFQS